MIQNDPWAGFEPVEQQPQGTLVGPPPAADPIAEANLRVRQQSENRQASTAERQLQIAERRLQHEINKANGKGPDAVDPQKLANINSIVDQINRVQLLFNESQRNNTVPIVGSAWEYLPTDANERFNSAAAGLSEQGLAAFRVPGVGSQSDAELKQFVEANKPSSRSFDSANLERLRTLRNRVDQTRAALGLPPADWQGIMPEDEGLTGMVTYEGPNPANAPAATPTPIPDDIDAIMQKYGGN